MDGFCLRVDNRIPNGTHAASDVNRMATLIPPKTKATGACQKATRLDATDLS